MMYSEGDSGRIMNQIQFLTLMFQASGLNNYALETLELSANFRYEWNLGVKTLYLNNCLENMSGKVGSWMEVDRFQEHVVRVVSERWNPNGNASSGRYLREVISINALSTKAVKEMVRMSATGRMARRSCRDNRERGDVAIITKEIVHQEVFSKMLREGPGRPYERSKDLLAEGTQKMLKGLTLDDWKWRTGLRRRMPYEGIKKKRKRYGWDDGENDTKPEEDNEPDIEDDTPIEQLFELDDFLDDDDENAMGLV